MKRIIALLLSLVMVISQSLIVIAEDEKYGSLNVEFSDNIGNDEHIQVMIKNNHVYANAEELCARLGYNIDTSSDKCITVYNTENEDLPYEYTQFFYDSTKVNHQLFWNLVDDYEAPFPSIYNDKGIWIPLEYSLLLLNSSMLILDNTLLIDMPEKKIEDCFWDITNNRNTYLFEWGKDFGYTDKEVSVITGSSHLVNLFNGVLKLEGDAWAQLFQSLALDSSSFDNKYGENIAMLMCTESSGELEAFQKEIEKYQDIFSEKGKMGDFLSTYSNTINTDVDSMYSTCSKILQDVQNENSTMSTYNRAYDALEKAFDKQTWFSKTGERIIDVQKGLSDTANILNVSAWIAEVVQYGQEFQNQDEFSIKALGTFLETSDNDTISSENLKESMEAYIKELEANVVEYSAHKFFTENIDKWIGNIVKEENLLGSQGNMALIVWDMASSYVPFIENGISSADAFELAVYSSILQTDSYINYLNYCNDTFTSNENMTSENLYEFSQYGYVYMKTCYIARNAAIASLDGKSESVKKRIQPLIEYQNSINDNISELLVKLKKAKENNEDFIYGFLPADNEEYLRDYSDEKLIKIVRENTIIEPKEGFYQYYDGEYVYGAKFRNVQRDSADVLFGMTPDINMPYKNELNMFTYYPNQSSYNVQDVRNNNEHNITIDFVDSDNVIIHISGENINVNGQFVYVGSVLIDPESTMGAVEISLDKICQIVAKHYNTLEKTDVYVVFPEESIETENGYQLMLRSTGGNVANTLVSNVVVDIDSGKVTDGFGNEWFLYE